MSFITNQLTGNITATGSIVPVSNTSTLGSAAQGWGNIYVANGNITIVPQNISVISGLIWDQALTYSTSPLDQLVIGQYGLTNGISAPYTVVQFTTVPSPPLQVGDLMTGNYIPPYSYILFVGSGIYNDIVIISQSVSNNVPPYGTIVSFTRAIVNPALKITTQSNTDITFNPGVGGQISAAGNIFPNGATYSLGARLNPWANLYLSNNVYVTDQTLGFNSILNASNGYFNILGTTGLTVGEFIFSGSNLAIQQSNVNITIGNSVDTGLVLFNRGIAVTNTITGTNTFSVSRQGLVSVLTPKTLLTTESALSITGTTDGYQQPRAFSGTLLQMTAQPNASGRVSIDTYGTGVYGILAARTARGTANTPTQTMANDVLMRFAGVPWNSNGSFTSNHVYIDMRAAENTTPSNVGTYVSILATPIGSNVVQTSANFYGNGIVMGSDGAVPTGITFADTSRQTTAWTGTTPASNITGLASVATTGCYASLSNPPAISTVGHTGQFGDLLGVPPTVYSVTVGDGLTQTLTSGNIGINATGVANVVAAPGYGQISVTDTGGKNLVLALPQALATNSLVTFGNLTITGNLTVNGTFTTTSNATVDSIILSLGNAATSISQIDGGGVVLGTAGFAKSIIYNVADNVWNTDGAGLQTLQLTANGTALNFLNVATQAHIGAAYTGYDYPNTPLQIDANFNGYSQVVSVNHSSGTCASTDYIATNNVGNNLAHYIDMGINGASFSNPNWTINGPNDGYLYVDAGNLAVGTDTPGTTLVFFTGGTFAANSAGYISSGGRWILGASDDQQTKLQVSGNANVTGSIGAYAVNVTNITVTGTAAIGTATAPGTYSNANLQVFGNNNNTMQVIAQNTNGGNNASSNFVAIANNGTDSTNYIDLGINSNAYSQASYSAQYPNDGYLYTSNSNLVISTAHVGARIVFTTDGVTTNNLAGFVTGQRWILGTTDDGHSKLQVGGNIALTGNMTAGGVVSAGSIQTTSVGTSGDLTVVGTARVNTLVANVAIQSLGTLTANTFASNTTSISQSLNVTGAAQVNSLTANLLTASTTLTVSGLSITNTLQSNGIITTNGLQSAAQVTASNFVANTSIAGQTLSIIGASQVGNLVANSSIQALGSLTANSLSSNSAIIGQTLNVTGTAQVNSLTTNLLTTSQSLTVSADLIANSIKSNIFGIFGQNVSIASANSTTSNTTGALTVAGGAAIGGNIYVGNSLWVGNAAISNTTVSTSATTGALIVAGGIGVAGNIYSAASAWAGNLSITNTTVSTNKSSGALIVAGGAGIAGNVSVGNLSIGAGTGDMAPINLESGVLKNNATQGSIEYDGTVLYATPLARQRGVMPAEQYYALQADRVFVPGSSSPVSLFGVGVSISANTRYEFTLQALVNHSTNYTTINLSWGGNAVLNKVVYTSFGVTAAINTPASATNAVGANVIANFGTGVNLTQTNITPGTPFSFKVNGMIDVGAGSGTLIPQIGWGNTPGTVTVVALSYMKISPVSTNTGNTSVGTWA